MNMYVIVCDIAQLLVSHDFIIVTLNSTRYTRSNLSINFRTACYSIFICSGVCYTFIGLPEDTKNIAWFIIVFSIHK